MSSRLLLILFAILATVVLLAPLPLHAAEPTEHHLRVTARSFAFEPGGLRVNHGDRVILEFESMDAKPVTLSPDDLGKVWDLIQEHIAIEKRTVEMANKALESVKGNKGMLVQSYLLNYLQTDETKHTRMLDDLEKIKGGMYPYG